MIRDLSQTLRVLLQRDVPPELASAQIVFDHPTEQFKPTQTTVNLFLYDLRENVELRNNETQMTFTNGQAVIQGTPLRLSCSYLATVWTVGASGDEQFLQEHRLLGQVFYALARYPTIPEDLLQGSLRGQQPPLPLSTSPIDTLKSFGEFWTALGNRLRPSISVTATLSMQTSPEQEPVSIVSRVDTQLEIVQSETSQIGGVLTMPNMEDLTRTTITLVELGYVTKPEPNGQYKFGNIPYRIGSASLPQTLRVQVGDRTQDYRITIPPTIRNSYNLEFN
jgi:Pvc16 N-terminal domain